ncbi:unnamed protein product [Soboliphyme baturini]|uniref:Uncharacterized protein n=1 Tax=Soboliphyme baturini TaxID=241478 RepID=A0A183ICE8_9BILA|nr:unnamed protein product [Soboliphyme baturini]
MENNEIFETQLLPVGSADKNAGRLETVAKSQGNLATCSSCIDVTEHYTGSVVARVTKGRAGCWGTEADGGKSAIRTCSLPSASRGRGSTRMADEDRRNDDEDTSQQRSRYPF